MNVGKSEKYSPLKKYYEKKRLKDKYLKCVL